MEYVELAAYFAIGFSLGYVAVAVVIAIVDRPRVWVDRYGRVRKGVPPRESR